MRRSYGIIAAHTGSRLKELRGACKQKEFALMLGMNQTQYNRYELGRRIPPDTVIIKLAQICGLETGQVLWGEGYKQPGGQRSAMAQLVDSLSQMIRVLDVGALEEVYAFVEARSKIALESRADILQRAGEALERVRKRPASRAL